VRQFFTLRFWMTLLALGRLVLAAIVISNRYGDDGGNDDGTVGAAADERTIDLIAWVYAVQPPPGFAVVNGRTNKDMALIIDGTRTMIIKAGTPGEVDCPRLAELAQCTVAADLLGDGVLWFSIIEGVPGATVELPAVAELLDGGWVRLSNDWVVQHAPKVERNCPEDTSSLDDFIDVFGDAATSIFNFEQQQIVRVNCPDVPDETTTTSTSIVPPTTIDPNVIDPTASTLEPITLDTTEAG
jgi:hypothetical protein